ncbi:MAG: T9SS type A sorting domain-containing protein [Bacteroidetes bacterium]|nr:T9SS type A sorting domain-containing protein [Bacteroidota bacterium]
MNSVYRPFARKYRQLKYRSRQFERLVKSGKWHLMSDQHKMDVLCRLKRLYQELSRVFSMARLKRAMAGAALILGLNMGMDAQPFAAGNVNPFGWSTDYLFPTNGFGDIDADGDLDLFSSGFSNLDPYWNVRFFQNTGDASSPDFPEPSSGAFGINDTELTNTRLVDIDNDGDLDAFIGHAFGDGSVYYYENEGTNSLPSFAAAQINPFGLTSGYFFNFLDLLDMDGDGDYDLVHTTQQGILTYFENTGTPEAPAYAPGVEDPFGLDQASGAYFVRLVDFVDFDKDGDNDVLYMSYDGPTNLLVMFYQENIGTAQDPVFDVQQADPFGITLPDPAFYQPTLVDIDDDGDLDLFLAGYYSGLFYYENLAPQNANPESMDTEIDVIINTDYPFAEADFPINDADGDLLAGVRIVSTVDMGALNYNGAPVGVNEEITVADLANLVYTPPTDFFGDDFTSFEFKVYDGSQYSTETYTMTVNVIMESAVSEAWKQARVNMHPNPTDNYLNVQAEALPDPGAAVRLVVIDAMGRQVIVREEGIYNGSLSTRVDVSALPAGWYSLQLIQDGQQRSFPFAVK